MTTPSHTPGGTPLPVPHGVGNPAGTPVVAPTRSAPHKDGGNSSLGTFGVSLLRYETANHDAKIEFL